MLRPKPTPSRSMLGPSSTWRKEDALLRSTKTPKGRRHAWTAASADSGDLFCNHLFEMLDVLAVEVGADPLDEFHFAQGAIRFNDGALGVDPLRLDSIQPR